MTDNNLGWRTGAVAARFVERAKALGLKGKAADAAALEYWVGASIGAEIACDETLARALGVQAAMIIAVRGYIGASEIAKRAEEAA